MTYKEGSKSGSRTEIYRSRPGCGSAILAQELTCVVELAAIVGCGEESDQLALGKELVPVLHHLEIS
jgi:hypothetical protein